MTATSDPITTRPRDDDPGGAPAPRAPATRPSARRRRRSVNPLAGLFALLWLAVVAVPLYVLLATTLNTRGGYLSRGPLAPPAQPTLDNYVSVFDKGYGQALLNTAAVTLGSVALVLLLAVPTAYAVVRSRSRLVGAGFRVFLLGLAIPAQATIIPVYLLITRLNLYDSLLAIILPTVAFSLPVAVLILTGSMRDVVEEYYDAMALDGAGATRMLLQLTIPVTRGGLATVAVFAGLQAWNGFLFPLVLTQSVDKRVLTTALWQFQTEYDTNVPGLLAAITLSAVPIFVAYLFARRALINGLMGAGGK